MRRLNEVLRERFGGKVYRLSLSADVTCPNRDGTLGTRGCIFCSAGGSGDFAASAALPIGRQIEEAKKAVVKAQRKMGYSVCSGDASVEFQAFLYSKYGTKLKA